MQRFLTRVRRTQRVQENLVLVPKILRPRTKTRTATSDTHTPRTLASFDYHFFVALCLKNNYFYSILIWARWDMLVHTLDNIHIWFLVRKPVRIFLKDIRSPSVRDSNPEIQNYHLSVYHIRYRLLLEVTGFWTNPEHCSDWLFWEVLPSFNNISNVTYHV